MQEDKKVRAIAVFAYNEARKIIACLESIKKNIWAGDECVVLNNGSTNRYQQIPTNRYRVRLDLL